MQTTYPSILPYGPTTETCGPNSSNSGTHGPRPSSIRVNTYPLLIGKDLLNRFEPLIDFKHLKIWTQVREPLPCQSLDSNESQCQVTDIAPKSMIDDAVAKPGSGPSTNSKDPFLCSLQEPEPNTSSLQIMTAIDVQGTSVSDTALALWAENSAISLKLFRTLKQRHQSLPHVAKHSRFPLSPWSTTMATSKIICALDIRWNNRHLSHYFLVVPDLPHDIYIGADIMVRLNACIDTVNDIIWAPLSHQLTTSVNLQNLQSGQTMRYDHGARSHNTCLQQECQRPPQHATWPNSKQ